MADVKYIKCDVCGKKIDNYPGVLNYKGGFRLFINGFLHHDTLDICDDCFAKLRQIKKNINLRDKVSDEVIGQAFGKYDDANLQSIYLEGVQDTLDCFELHMLGKSKI